MRYFIFPLVIVDIFISCAASSVCPCWDIDTNRIVWKGYKCSNENPNNDHESANIGDLNEIQIIPLFCPQPLRRCIETEFCTNGWSEWISIKQCAVSCFSNLMMWKRTCKEKLPFKVDCPFENSEESCRNEACGMDNMISRINDISTSMTETRNLNFIDSDKADTPHHAQTSPCAAERALRSSVDPQTDEISRDVTELPESVFTDYVFPQERMTANTDTAVADERATRQSSIKKRETRDLLLPTSLMRKNEERDTKRNKDTLKTNLTGNEMNNYNDTPVQNASKIIIYSTKSINYMNGEALTESLTRTNPTTEPTEVTESSSKATEATNSVKFVDLFVSTNQNILNETNFGAIVNTKSTPTLEKMTNTSSFLSDTTTATQSQNNASTSIRRTTTIPNNTQTYKETTTAAMITSKKSIQQASASRSNLMSNSTDTIIKDHSLTHLILIKIVLGVFGFIGWVCFITACCFWMKQRQQQKSLTRSYGSVRRFEQSVRSVTSASGLYESIGPQLPPPRFPIYASMQRFDGSYQAATDYYLVEAGLCPNANDLYVDPATLPCCNKRYRAARNDDDMDESNNLRLDCSASNAARISHSEFHQNGYLTPVHLCRDDDTGYVSFNVNSDNDSRADEHAENCSKKPKSKQKSAVVFTFPNIKSKNLEDASVFTADTSQNLHLYEKKRQKSYRRIRPKHRPNIRILIKRPSSKRQKSFSTSDETPRRPRFTNDSPQSPQLANSESFVAHNSTSKMITSLDETETSTLTIHSSETHHAVKIENSEVKKCTNEIKTLQKTEDTKKQTNNDEKPPEAEKDQEKENGIRTTKKTKTDVEIPSAISKETQQTNC